MYLECMPIVVRKVIEIGAISLQLDQTKGYVCWHSSAKRRHDDIRGKICDQPADVKCSAYIGAVDARVCRNIHSMDAKKAVGAACASPTAGCTMIPLYLWMIGRYSVGLVNPLCKVIFADSSVAVVGLPAPSRNLTNT